MKKNSLPWAKSQLIQRGTIYPLAQPYPLSCFINLCFYWLTPKLFWPSIFLYWKDSFPPSSMGLFHKIRVF
jgi:hypothetical protein